RTCPDRYTPDASGSGAWTPHDRLFVAQQERIVYERLVGILTDLEVAVRMPDPQTVVATLRRLLASFLPGGTLRPDAPAARAELQAGRTSAPERRDDPRGERGRRGRGSRR